MIRRAHRTGTVVATLALACTDAVVPGDGSAEAVRDFCVESFPLRD